jgi:hypothetical protein
MGREHDQKYAARHGRGREARSGDPAAALAESHSFSRPGDSVSSGRLLFTVRRVAANLIPAPMPKITEQWLLFEYVGGEFTPLSKHFKTKEQAEKARSEYPERRRKTVCLQGHPRLR